MDPNTALEWMREAIRDGRRHDADEHAADILAWLKRGGFPPADLTISEARYLHEAAARVRWEQVA